MSKIILYSTGCPQCKVLKQLLEKSDVHYDICSDVDKMMGMGISSVPMLDVDGELMNFPAAMKWAKEVKLREN